MRYSETFEPLVLPWLVCESAKTTLHSGCNRHFHRIYAPLSTFADCQLEAVLTICQSSERSIDGLFTRLAHIRGLYMALHFNCKLTKEIASAIFVQSIGQLNS